MTPTAPLTPTPLTSTPPMTPTARPASYVPELNTPGGLTAELERLERQASLTWDAEWDVLAPLGVPAGGRVLDLGCAAGAVLQRLAAALPGRDVVGLDVDPAMLQAAQHRRSRPDSTSRPTLVTGRGAALPLRDACCDAVLARYVLQHVPDPAALLREAARVLRPGGWLACTDVDEQLWGVAQPDDPSLGDVYRRAALTQASRGGDRAVVRRLPRLLTAAGFTDVRVRPFAVTSHERPVADLAVHLSPERLLPALADGRISMADYGRVALAGRRLESDPDAYVLLLGFAVTARLPEVRP